MKKFYNDPEIELHEVSSEYWSTNIVVSVWGG